MSLIIEYLKMQKGYEAKYGERTVVIMHIGTFYETYEYDPTYCTDDQYKVDDTGTVWPDGVGHSMQLSIILNYSLAYNDGTKPYGIKSPHKMGFPIISYEKNRDTLLANDYVIVRLDQVKAGDGTITRQVTEILSPVMQLDRINLRQVTSNVACIYIEYQSGVKYENFLVITGAAVLDVITGANCVYEFYSKPEDQIHSIQELYRFLLSHYPRELLIHISDLPRGLDTHTDSQPNPYVKFLDTILELRRFDRLNVYVNTMPDDYKKIAYQIDFLNKLFNTKSVHQFNIIQKRNDKIIMDLGLERMNYGRIAYIALLNHCYSYNPDIVSKLSKPKFQWVDANNHLILTHNAIIQLDLIPNNEEPKSKRRKTEINSLLAVLDQTHTYLGRRVLTDLLRNPMLGHEDINTHYDMISEMLTAGNSGGLDPLWTVLDKKLKGFPDIGRFQRKLELKMINPKELTLLYGAYGKVVNIYVSTVQYPAPTVHKQLLNLETRTDFNAYMKYFGSRINFEYLVLCHIDTSVELGVKWLEFEDYPLHPGYFPDLDQQNALLIEAETRLQLIVDHLTDFISDTRGKKIEYKQVKKKQGAVKQDVTANILITTPAKAATLIDSAVDVSLCGQIRAIASSNKSERVITSDKIEALNDQITKIRIWMKQRLYAVYLGFLDEMTTKYTFYVPLANLVAKLDLIHSYAKVSHLYNYHRPEIVMDDCPVSFLEANEIRHPIIERLIDGAYVTNDINLGRGNCERSNGILLYGVNQTGKSSLVKATALNIIMAQIGCFVPSKLKYKPYSKIITRLSGADNIFKGESSFAIEMTELRTILRQAECTTLVIGDELAKGTESDSATGITVSTIKSLVKSEASFIFATHMHHLVDIPYITELASKFLKIYHLSVQYDPKSDILIYERTKKPGPGSAVYGIMVAQSLGLPADFIDYAYEITRYLRGTGSHIVCPKQSRYNSELYVSACAMCDKTREQTELHTHHIQEQVLADERNLIGNMHKNVKGNLIVLCKACHTGLHKAKLELETVQTSEGTVIRFKELVG